jgi:hypothetical protein
MSLGFRYFLCFNWALHNFSLATSTIKAQNEVEWVFAAVITLLGMAGFLFYASTVTCSAMEMKNLQGETVKEFWLLRRFLRQREVPVALQFRIINYSEVSGRKEIEKLPQDRVTLLSFLSEQLRCELDFNMSYSRLFHHPLMHNLDGKAQTLQELTATALSKHSYAPEDMVGEQERPAFHMIFVVLGSLKYENTNHFKHNCTLEDDDWLAEACLWIPWAYQGNTKALTMAELIFVEAVTFCQVIDNDLSLWSLFARYATKFIEHLNSIPHSALTDVSAGSKACRDVAKVLKLIEAHAEDDFARTESMVNNGDADLPPTMDKVNPPDDLGRRPVTPADDPGMRLLVKQGDR